VVSRESAFLLNNVLLVAAAFTVFFGTVFPLISEAVRASRSAWARRSSTR
jgi:cytochrome c-type biogenesis protein CcmF